ncbi:MAG: hypothetical protein AVDCRST_MAG25-13 [uncultured Rubrobacteraceae bacterium]|uniref:Uncharacterized protein n=1 Tax=uncultured Rubrobacteraceae bacterium TaxID=349277 RepID=A0A6J4QVV9_9ACTN|nr:MAG: hypothetical protein AVDCRST_MAG25-13 [uncultured Rubrobacteraceae bacterium]
MWESGGARREKGTVQGLLTHAYFPNSRLLPAASREGSSIR